MKFSAVVCILILLKTSAAQVATCRDDGDANTDWFFVYKPPNSLNSKIIKSAAAPAWTASAQAIDQRAGHSISTTMASFIADHMNIKVLAYSDDPPNLPPRNEKSKAKGVLLVDNTGTDAAAWFVHTVPKFLAHLGGYSWPAAETVKGHMFLCVSFVEAHLNSVAKAIRYQEPYIYANNLPAALLSQHIELSNLATGVEIRITPFLEHAKFTTKAVQVAANIQAIGKHTKSFSDMYARVLKNKLAASIRIWAPSDTRSKSICKGQYHLRKITSPMQFDGVPVSRESDSAKWALVEGKNTVCLTTNDYKVSEKQIPGAAVCLENANVYNAFSIAASNVEACKEKLSKYQTFIEIMFTAVIFILISLKSCTAQVSTCKDDGNIDVDWFFVYKPPNVLSTKLLKSAANPVWTRSAQAIDQGRGHAIFTTMASFIADHMNIKVLAYSDDPPNLPPRNEKSKAKGVLLVDNTGTDAAAWFVHTVPKFLAHLGGYSWPAAETTKGHIFLCVSFIEAHLNSVAKAIRYQEPYIYANNLPPALLNQHNELSNLAKGVEIQVTPFMEHSKFATKAAQVAANIQAFGKHSKSFADMYARVLRNRLSANIRIWAPSDARSKSICKGQHQLRKIASPMQFDGVQVSREADSSKWALVEEKNIVCLTTNDYKTNEKQIPDFFPLQNICIFRYFVYKPPNVLNTQIIKSERNPTWANSAATIDQGAGHSVIRTMTDYVQNNPRINVLAYSDDPPNLPPRNVKSKTKGVILVDNGADAAAWFVHTVPNFLAHLGGYSWPQSETAKGHMFLCLSFDKAHLNLVGKAIRHQEPYIYANNLPPAILNQYMELSNLVNGVDIRITPFLEHAKFTTKAAHAAANIQAFGKHSKSFADMYARILRNKFSASIRIWAPSDARSKSICKGQYQLRKIASPMQLAGSQISREADNAKWALLEGKNTVCFTTNDYKVGC
ncbi:Plancitoxin-1 [Trichinella pseudospiralis]|uniref:Plancitoxin-1 n=1 Tax=Trichinella pseudospiralis TaxID=6337 RepID=A0A0V1F755_TRIPS|nr:Plancitoxin-1 [Trichinella pseudospiralis]